MADVPNNPVVWVCFCKGNAVQRQFLQRPKSSAKIAHQFALHYRAWTRVIRDKAGNCSFLKHASQAGESTWSK